MRRHVFLGILLCASCREADAEGPVALAVVPEPVPEAVENEAAGPDLTMGLIHAAIERTEHKVDYLADYVSIPYPNGDVPDSTGVCTDVVIRSYRQIGIDLQALVHLDMTAEFDKYPKAWGLDKPDSNIDHRRVPNLRVFFSRHGKSKKRSTNPADYQPGDVVTWDVGRNGKYVDHIGIVVNVLSDDQQRLHVVHNIGPGPKMEDVLFRWPITGHYRYLP
jgi:hypothetical protein